MGKLQVVNNMVHHYMDELTSRVVAASGRPSDRFHIGKLVLLGLKDAPGFVLQIDGDTGMSETSSSVLERSVRCATCFRALGLGCGDVVAIMAPNHLDLCVPLYAALFLGITLSPLDWTLGAKETADLFAISRPKLIFCQQEKFNIVQEATKLIKLDATIVSFGEGRGGSCLSFQKFLKKYEKQVAVDEFKASDFNTEEIGSVILSTSGTTGSSKAAAHTHKSLILGFISAMSMFENFPTPTRMLLLSSPIQWISAVNLFVMSPILRFTRLQNSGPQTTGNALQIIRKYQPTCALVSPPFVTWLTKSAEFRAGDLASFEVLLIGGSAVTEDVIKHVHEIAPSTQLVTGYGLSETGVVHIDDGSSRITALKPLGHIKCRLVNPSTGLDIEKPKEPGELWLKGPSLFYGYYNNPQETKEALSDDGWMKTGDIFFKDEDGRYFFIERAKMLLKYRVHQVSPAEVESVIRQHPSVLDAAVGGIPDEECGELIVACVVRKPNYDVTAQEIKDLVKDSLADSKQLRGGVIFLKELPLTPTCKVDRKKLREVVLQNERL